MKAGNLKYYFDYTMMISLPVLSLMLFINYSCKQRTAATAQYVNHEKWEMYGEEHGGVVRGNPAEVKQIEYSTISDTTVDATGTPKSYQLSRFDKEGNRVYMLLTSDTVMSIENFTTYDENGMSYRIVSRSHFGESNDSIVSHTRSTKEGPGKYREISTRSDDSIAKRYTLSYYENGGNTVKTERWVDDKLRYKMQSDYSNGKLMSMTYRIQEGENVTYTYHYSAKGFLDSVTAKSGKYAKGKKFYINNEHGDPVYYEETENGSLLNRQTISYRYDDKGNWIRRIIYFDPSTPANKPDPTKVNKRSDYKLETREIKY